MPTMGKETSADEARGLETGLLQHEREHRGRGRLAVRAGDGARLHPLREQADGARVLEHGQPAAARLGDRRRVRRHGGGVDHALDVRRQHVRLRARGDGETEPAQRVDTLALARVRPAHAVATAVQEPRERRHAGAPGAQQVQPLRAG